MADPRHVTPARRAKLTQFAADIARMHARAHNLGLYKTGHALHEAVRAAGWEVAEQIESTPTRVIYEGLSNSELESMGVES